MLFNKSCVFYLFFAFFLTSCDESVEEPKYQEATIRGKASIGVVNSGTVTAYDFSNCEQGAQLDQGELDQDGGFSLSFQPTGPDTPVLLILKDFQYTEEASGVKLRSKESKMYATDVIHLGSTSSTPITYWTTLSFAAIKNSCSPSTVISDINTGNKNISDSLRLDIIKTIPVPIATATDTSINGDQIRYGIANAAVSFYMLDKETKYGTGDGSQVIYNSLLYIDTMLEDILDDSKS